MINVGQMSFPSGSSAGFKNGINGIDINFSVENRDIIIGAVLVNSLKCPDDTVVAKLFIYKYTTPAFIEVNFDETYIDYLFDNPADALNEIADYTLKMLTIDFPMSILSIASSVDIGMVQLPQTVNK